MGVRLSPSAPFRNKIGNGRPVGRLFLDFGGAKARYFIGGMKKLVVACDDIFVLYF